MVVPFLLALFLELAFLIMQWSPLSYVFSDARATQVLAQYGSTYELSLLPVLQTLLALLLAVVGVFLVPGLVRALRDVWPLGGAAAVARRRRKAQEREQGGDESVLYIVLFLASVIVKGFMQAIVIWFLDDNISSLQSLVTSTSFQSDTNVVQVLSNCLASCEQAWMYGLMWLVLLGVEIAGSCFYLGRATAPSARGTKSS